MKFNKNSNTYIITYSTVMVVVVAALLSFTALSLKKAQDLNVEIEKKTDILRAAGVGGNLADASNSAIEDEYSKYITESYAINTKGDVVEGVDAFETLIALKAEYDKPEAERALPIFVSEDAGAKHYIIPVYGSGLWGPIWGYIALDQNWDTVYGVVFDHKAETPGLGAEIATPQFTDQFKNKLIYRDGQLTGILVLKGAGSSNGNPSAVDAISGGTITSRAVEKMIKDCLMNYNAYLGKQRSNSQDVAPQAEVVASDSTTVNQ